MRSGLPDYVPTVLGIHPTSPACSGTTRRRNSCPSRWPDPTICRPVRPGATATPTTSCSG
jgi:hypothetical protein